MTPGAAHRDHDVYIVSDLHLGRGIQEPGDRYSRLEGFFYDDVFERFLENILREQALRNQPALLLLGGDVFDFLATTSLPNRLEARQMGIQLTRELRRFGLAHTPKHAEWKLRHIARGHPRFFRALGKWLASGHRICVVSGNHDAELYWARVRETVVELVLTQAVRIRPDLNAAEAQARIFFRNWFYREPGRFYFEHGNQYEASNSFRYNLCPVHPTNKGELSKELDPPIGSLFARYIANEGRKREPYVATMLSLEQYMGALARMNLVEIFVVFFRRLPFFVKALRTARLFESSAWRKVQERHRQALQELARQEGLPVSALERLQRLRAVPDGMTKYHLAMNMLKPVLFKMVKYTVLGLAAVFVWFAVFSLIQNTPWLAESFLGKASLTALFAMITVLVMLVYLNRVMSKVRQVAIGVVPELSFKARIIAQLARVKHVVMGHTHVVDLKRLPNTGGFYANTGTWMPTTGKWDFLWPQSRRFPFVRIRGDELQLLRWDDEAGRCVPIPFLEEYRLGPADVLLPDEPVRADGPVVESSTLSELLERVREE